MGAQARLRQSQPRHRALQGRLLLGTCARPCRAGHGGAPASSAKSGEHKAILIGLGFIGTPEAVKVLLDVLTDKKAERPTTAAEDGIYCQATSARCPSCCDTAKNGYVVVGGVKASDLRANAAIDLPYRRKETYDAFKALAAKEKDAQGSSARRLTDAGSQRLRQRHRLLRKVLNTGSVMDSRRKARSPSASPATPQGRAHPLNALKPVASLSRTLPRAPGDPAVAHQAGRCLMQAVRGEVAQQIERDEQASVCPARVYLLGETAWPGGHQNKKKAN